MVYKVPSEGNLTYHVWRFGFPGRTFRKMSLKQKMDVLDFVITVLREHELALDKLKDRFENILGEVEEKIVYKETGLEISSIINLLENKPFETNFISFYDEPNTRGDHTIIDKKNNRKLIFGRSHEKSNIDLWNVYQYSLEETTDRKTEQHYFDSEKTMLAWIIRYLAQIHK
jgi:hypothetical protein